MKINMLDANEAARRLGVKPATLYAYVSRGVLRRRRGADGRSLFDADEVERLARRGRPRRGPAPAEVVIESAITALGPDRPYFRGRDALDLAASSEFEAVATWLWTESFEVGAPWQAAPEAVAAGRAAQSALSGEVLPLERLQIIVPALGAVDPRRLNLDPAAVVTVAQTLIAGMITALPPALPLADQGQMGVVQRSNHPHLPLIGELWGKLTVAPADDGLVDALRVALVLLADHELAASTLAARVAASVRADPYAVVSAGLAAMGGAFHGGASLGTEALLADVLRSGQAGPALEMRLRRGERIPGFGHSVYKGQDGRGRLLLDRVRAAHPDHDGLAAADAVLAEARRLGLPEPNIDFALATLSTVAGMASGSGEAIFAIARTAGWLAHALEEYANPTHLRLRAAYVGHPPG